MEKINNTEELKKVFKEALIREYGKEKAKKILKIFLNKKFKELINEILKNFAENKLEKTYIVYVILDEKLKNNYKPKLLNKSIEVIKNKLKISKEQIFFYYFKDLIEVEPEIIKGIPETPYYIIYEINKKEGIKLAGTESGYIIG